MQRVSVVALLFVAASTMLRMEGECRMAVTEYHAVTLVDRNDPLPPEWLQRSHVDYVYTGAPAIEDGPDGEPVIATDQRERWDALMRLYEGTDVQVLVMGNFYTDPDEGQEAVDAFGRSHPISCFRNPDFQQAMTDRIVAIARALEHYPTFGGFVFDDGAHVRVDCCYCDRCIEQFRAEHGVDPPEFEAVQGTARVPDDDPVVLWEQFQRESWEIYLQTQSAAVRSVSEDLLMLTIPSDSYFYGRFLNVTVAPEETRLGHGARLQRIERGQVHRWTIWQSFPLSRVPEEDERGLQPWAVGTHITAHSPKMLMQTEGPYAPVYGRVQYMSPAEIERMARVTIAEGANSLCAWTPAEPLPSYPAALDALSEVYRDVGRIERELMGRRPVTSRIGLLYSTTTETMQQRWRRQTSDRWQHLHAFEALAYSMRRSNIPFDIVFEEETTPARLSELSALVLPAVPFLTESAATAIEQAIGEHGLRVLAAGQCVGLVGMIPTECDPLIWHDWARRGYRQQEHADAQWQNVRTTIAHELLPLIDAPVRVYSELAVSRLYELEDGDLMLMVASWDLDEIIEVAIEGVGEATDMLSGRSQGRTSQIGRLTIPPAGWRVLRISR